MIKYIVLGGALMVIAVLAGSQMQQSYAQTTTSPTMTPTATPTTSVPKAAPATGRGM